MSEFAGTEPAWVSKPANLFDIVTAFFPENSGLNEPGLKLRPGLVVRVLRGKTSGKFYCDIAYGTKNLKITQRLHLDLIVQNAADITHFGLARATRFDLDHVATLPWNSEFFGCWTGYATPVIGALTEDYIKTYAFLMYCRGLASPKSKTTP